MSRNAARPDGYRPGLELSCRAALEGGAIRDPAQARWAAGVPTTRLRCTVLVHGYNNNDGEAAQAYLGFRKRGYEEFPALLPGALETRLADAYWPGDADWPGPLDFLDFLFYPRAVPVAVGTAPVLAAAIRSIPGLVSIDVIAHSLGCRVALQAIGELLASGPRVERVCLMAGAVPVEFLQGDGRYEPVLRALLAQGTPVRVLHSRADLVLRFAFPPGQAAAFEPSLQALGLYGPTPGMPGFGANISERRIPGAGHSDYWGHNDDPSAAYDAAEFLKLGEAARVVGKIRII